MALRIETAKTLLTNFHLSVKEIAAQCGYPTTSSLTREFKRQFGLTPSIYRRSTSG